MKLGIDYIGISTPFYCNDGQGCFLLHKRSKNFGFQFTLSHYKEYFEKYKKK
ncbi:MAG TPA: hypothetical protein VI998_04000 [Patescibacteria group bacterium]|nr:hypothetical protein [Patescibacteria group bacterium]